MKRKEECGLNYEYGSSEFYFIVPRSSFIVYLLPPDNIPFSHPQDLIRGRCSGQHF